MVIKPSEAQPGDSVVDYPLMADSVVTSVVTWPRKNKTVGVKLSFEDGGTLVTSDDFLITVTRGGVAV